METKYRIMDDMYAFDLFVDENTNDTTLLLKRSKDTRRWNPQFAGKSAVKLHDDGNGVSVKIDGRKSFRLDYGELADLFVVLKERMLMEEKRVGRPSYEKFLKVD